VPRPGATEVPPLYRVGEHLRRTDPRVQNFEPDVGTYDPTVEFADMAIT
jgi:hypothetical protein